MCCKQSTKMRTRVHEKHRSQNNFTQQDHRVIRNLLVLYAGDSNVRVRQPVTQRPAVLPLLPFGHRRMYIHKVIIIIGDNVSSRAVPINSSNASTLLQLGVE